jgi:hypothetical protein
MVKAVQPNEMTADTTIEEMWEGFNEQVAHHVVGSDEYLIAKMLFASGARAALGLATKIAPFVGNVVAQRQLVKMEQDLDAMLDEYIEWCRAEEEADSQTV